MRIDLHTHSHRSDGTSTPEELVEEARAAGLDVIAITDHDTTAGWEEAAKAGARHGVRVVRGIEISCKLSGQGVHLLAYLPDPTYPPLVEELDRILDGRKARLPATLRRLRELGIDIDETDVRRVAGDAAAMGRPHVADALVDKGVVVDRREAFNRFLGSHGPAYVNRYAAPIEAMIGSVTEAGGVSVIAHPWAKRHNTDALDEDRFALLKDEGLAGIEVDHQDHDPEARERLRAIARDLDLVVTGSSDYHGSGKTGHELGCNTTDPEEFERLMQLAKAAAEKSGRSVPEVLAP